MTRGTSGPESDEPFAVYDRAGSCWRTSQGTFPWDSGEFSATWPKTGTTRAGCAYVRPMSERHIVASESSSLLGTPSAADALGGHLTRGGDRSSELLLPGQVKALMPTPRVSDANGAGQHGEGGPDLRTALLPTPAVNDMGAGKSPEEWDAWTDAMRERHGNGNGHGRSLEQEALRLLPTPRSQNGEDRNNRAWVRPLDEPQNLENAVARIGDSTNPRSDDGNSSSDDPPRLPSTSDDSPPASSSG